MKKIYFIGALLATSLSFGQVVISQVYGGGGNGGATYTNDFIELFNRGTVAQSINGWSVQYNSAAGTGTWSIKTDLPNVTIQPGQYYLIQEASNAAVGVALPTPDFNGVSAASTSPTGIALSASNGKVVLANSTVFVTGSNPVDAQIVDKVGFGATPTGFEGTGPTGTALTSTTSVQRNSGGCTDTDSNPNDFTTGPVAPRNSATATNNCSLSAKDFGNISGLKVYPNPAKTVLNITSNSFADKNVEIYNVLGKVVLTTKVTNTPVNVAGLTSGVYIVKVTQEGKSDARRIVIE